MANDKKNTEVVLFTKEDSEVKGSEKTTESQQSGCTLCSGSGWIYINGFGFMCPCKMTQP